MAGKTSPAPVLPSMDILRQFKIDIQTAVDGALGKCDDELPGAVTTDEVARHSLATLKAMVAVLQEASRNLQGVVSQTETPETGRLRRTVSQTFEDMDLTRVSSTDGCLSPLSESGEVFNFERADYLRLLATYPDLLAGERDWRKGKIEIITDEKTIQEAERQTKTKVGILAQDKWLYWINDAVRLPTGDLDTQTRIVWKPQLEGRAGAAVLAELPDGQIMLHLLYRHTTGQWELELPRIVGEELEITSQFKPSALEKEKAALSKGNRTPLGDVTSDTDMTPTVISTMKISIPPGIEVDELRKVDDSPIRLFTRDEILTSAKRGYVTLTIHGEAVQVQVRDSYLFSALLLEKARFGSLTQAVVLPTTEDGRVMVHLLKRSESGKWEIEIPRGAGEAMDILFQRLPEAKQKERGDLVCEDPIYYGEVSSGSYSHPKLAPVTKLVMPDSAFFEDVDDTPTFAVRFFTVPELLSAAKTGAMHTTVNGVEAEVEIRDTYLLSALTLDGLRKT